MEDPNDPNNPNNPNNKYWIVEDAIIFKPEFNESLDNYSDIISNCRILIFSNYKDPPTTLKKMMNIME